MNVNISEPEVSVKVSAPRVTAETGTPVAREWVEREAYAGPYTVTPSESAQTLDTDGKRMTDDMEIGAISSSYVGSGITRRSSTDLSASGGTVTAPAGYYSEAASKSVQSGTEGTPAASKSAVSNHAVTVTPSVTNTEGYISGGTHTGAAVQVTAAELESGTKQITSNGEGIDVGGYAEVDVSVTPAMLGIVDTVTPSESEQVKTYSPSSGFDGLSGVKVTTEAISSHYIGSEVPRRAYGDLVASGNMVTVPAGWYASQASKSVASGTEGTPSATKGTVSNHSVDVTPSVTNVAGYVAGGTHTGTAVTVTAAELESGTLQITENDVGIDVTGYAAVDVAVPDSNFIVTIEWDDVNELWVPDKTYAEIEAAWLGNVPIVTAPVEPQYVFASGYFFVDEYVYYVFDGTTRTAYKLQSSGLPTVLSSYDLYDTSDATISGNGQLLSGVKAVGADGTVYTGNIPSKSSSDLTASGATVTVPAGHYASQATKSVASGTEGTPSATKGAVSNHAVTVTPSVTNAAGYIAGGTHTGIGVQVTAAELESGTKQISANGTGIDVTGYAAVDVAVPTGTSKNTQIVQGTTRTNASTLTAIGAELTVSKSGTYDIYYTCMRTNTSSSYTWGTRLYIDGTAQGTENTTWNNNLQNTHLTNVSLTAGQKLRVYGRETRGTSYYVYAPMLAIVEA